MGYTQTACMRVPSWGLRVVTLLTLTSLVGTLLILEGCAGEKYFISRKNMSKVHLGMTFDQFSQKVVKNTLGGHCVYNTGGQVWQYTVEEVGYLRDETGYPHGVYVQTDYWFWFYNDKLRKWGGHGAIESPQDWLLK